MTGVDRQMLLEHPEGMAGVWLVEMTSLLAGCCGRARALIN